MKLVLALLLSLGVAITAYAADAPKKDEKAVEQKKENDNCVKKDKNGKCPPDRKSTRLNSSHIPLSRMPSSA